VLLRQRLQVNPVLLAPLSGPLSGLITGSRSPVPEATP
jgi:hypothetical protein